MIGSTPRRGSSVGLKVGTKEMRGLWAELLFIASLPDPSTGARRWHDDPDEQFDFVATPFGVEGEAAVLRSPTNSPLLTRSTPAPN